MNCQECQDLLLLYASGALDPAEIAAVRAHLATGCVACAGELAAAEATLHKVPLGLPLQAAPAAAWEKLEMRVALKEQVEGAGDGRDRAALAAPFVPRRKIPVWTGWAAAAVIAVVLGILWQSAARENARYADQIAQLKNVETQNARLQFQLAEVQRQLTEQNTRFAESSKTLQEKVEFLMHSDQFAVAATPVLQPSGSGRLFWNKGQQRWEIYLEGVKPPEEGKTYELWIVTANDKLAAGTAQVNDKGQLTFVTTRKFPAEAIAAAAITDEKSGGEGDNGAKGQVHFLAKLTN